MYLRKIFLLTLLSCLISGIIAQEVELLSPNINTPQEEREPILSPDGKTMYFWRRIYAQNTGGLTDPGDIWFSRMLSNGNWGPAKRAPQPLNSFGHDFVWHVESNGNKLWINQHSTNSRASGIYYSKRTSRGWSTLRPGTIRGFRYKGNYKDFHLGPNNIMLIPNEGDNSFGGTDLYVAFPVNDSTWTVPVNMGPIINSAGDDDAPFLTEDGMTLYFNSNGRGGVGDHDIFVSHRLDDSWQEWTEPVSLGAPFNTPGYDFDFILSKDEEYAYWCSSSGKIGGNDIFRYPLKSCEMTVYPEGRQTICAGSTLNLQASFTMAEGVRYQWHKDGVRIPGATDRELEVSEAGSYHLIRYSHTCISESESIEVGIAEPPIAEVSTLSKVICLDDSVRLRTKLQYEVKYQWQKNGLDIPNAKRPVYWVNTPGEYRLKVSNESCEVFSQPIPINRFQQPRISEKPSARDKLNYQVQKWDWVNRLEPQKGVESMAGLAVAQDGSPYVMTLHEDKRGRIVEQITAYYPEGPYRMMLPTKRKSNAKSRFMVVDNEDNLLVARSDELLAKYRKDGRLLWKVDQSINDISGLTTDDLGYVYVSGRYKGEARMGNQILSAYKRGGFFVAKYTPFGDLVWVNSYPVDGEDENGGNLLYTDCDGYIYALGKFNTIANLRDKILRNPSRGHAYFIARFAPDGKLAWARKYLTDKMGLNSFDLHADCKGNAYMVLNYSIIKLDRSGSQEYMYTLKAPGFPNKVRIASNDLEELFLISNSTEKGQLFMTKLDLRGQQVLLWQGKSESLTKYDQPLISRDVRGNMFIAAVSKGDVPPATALATKEKSKSFLAKYGKPIQSLKPSAIELCDGETKTLYVGQESNVAYQWYRDGEEIAGATGESYLVKEPGSYTVKASANLCDRYSPAQEVIACTSEELVRQPKTSPPIASNSSPKPNPDLTSDRNGKPVRLKKRPIRKQGELTVESTEIKLYVWDHGADDNDTISLNVNGTWLLEDYRLTKKRKEVEVSLNSYSDFNYIILYAKNLGSVPPNTATIMVDDGYTQQTTKLRSNLNSNGAIHLKLPDIISQKIQKE